MASSSSLIPDTSPTAHAFIDAHSRQLLLRGLNVSGCAKFPLPNPLAGTPGFYDVSTTSYIGRPFSTPADAAQWWVQMKSWGVTVVRLVVVWEALEPRAMGEYDDAYIDYVHDMVKEAEKIGLRVFIDGHQDTWSRFTGGSGAPLWTFSLAGLDARVFGETCSAALDEPGSGGSSSLSTPSGRLWPTNYSKFGVATMFTIFFAGELFAPSAIYDGEVVEFQGWNIGRVLRTSYIRAFARLMRRLKDCSNVLGVDPMNEPHPGYIGLPSLERWNENTDLHLGWMPSAIAGMRLAAGEPTAVGYYTRSWPHPSYKTRTRTLNTTRTRAWLPGREDIWAKEGVYKPGDGDGDGDGCHASYFTANPRTGKAVDFERDCYIPFLRSFHASILSAIANGRAGAWLFVEPIPNLPPPIWSTTPLPLSHTPTPPTAPPTAENMICYTPHWYDIRTLFEKALNPTITFDVLSLAAGSRNFLAHTYFGASGLAANYTANFRRFASHLPKFRPGKEEEEKKKKHTPMLIGETGVPMDLNQQGFYRGDQRVQETMLDAMCTAMEKCGLSWTLWTFTPHHHTLGATSSLPLDNETGAQHQSGDGWNSEDFSVVGADGNLRLPRAMLRPYPMATAGLVIESEFGMRETRFELTYEPAKVVFEEEGIVVKRTTEIFVPNFHFSGRTSLKVLVIPSGDGGGGGGVIPVQENEWNIQRKRVVVAVAVAGEAPQMEHGKWTWLEWWWDRQEQVLKIVHAPALGGRTKVVVKLEALEAGEGGIAVVEKVGIVRGLLAGIL